MTLLILRDLFRRFSVVASSNGLVARCASFV